jgi:PAS domain S-box-containing protein
MGEKTDSIEHEIEGLRIRLQEAEETLSAIRSGEVDAVVVSGPAGEQVFTLKGADHAYRTIVEQMNEGALTLSTDGTILYCNSRFADLIKQPLERVIGASFGAFVGGDDDATFQRALTAPGQTRAQISLHASDGARVPVYISSNRVSIDKNEAVCLIVTDLTERNRQEAILIDERCKADEQIRANDRLAAMGTTAAALAHEIANPLNWIYTTVQLMQLQLAKQEKDPDGSWKTQLQDIHDEIGRLSSLLREFRSLARPLQLHVTAIQTKDFLAEVEKVMAPDLESAAVQTEHSISAELPVLNVDGERLRQVFLNIYKNAIEAMPSGGKLSVRIYPEAGNAIIEITDTGAGIPEDVDIFAPFATTKDKGTGLGLMVVRQIIAAHDGSISYTSRSGQGTTFRISLPLSRAAQSAA